MSDITIKCKDCGKNFVFTENEQQFYKEKGFETYPVRCKECKTKKNESFNAKKQCSFFETVCAQCGAPTRLPFVPKGTKPAFCDKCKEQKDKAQAERDNTENK